MRRSCPEAFPRGFHRALGRPTAGTRQLLTSALLTGMLASSVATAGPGPDDWQSLFNGHDLTGWTPKLRGYPAGENPGETFRVVDGLLTVAYDSGYPSFDDRFGHLYSDQAWSHYRLRLEYRFLGEQVPGGPDWAWRNSGVMLHAQAAEELELDQDFPVCAEAQFLGGRSDGSPRTTGNLCTPGTHVELGGEFTEAHCIESVSPTLDGDQWVRFEALVLGSERIVHYINGEAVLEYGGVVVGGAGATRSGAEAVAEGSPLGSGHLALQSESHPVQFRNIEILNLKGCMDPASPRFRDWYVEPDPAACEP